MIALDLDIARPRITRTLLCSAAFGTYWDIDASAASNGWITPYGALGMIRPYQARAEWGQDGTGNYARLDLADWGITVPSSSWVENVRRFPGDIWIENLGVNTALTSTASYSINRPFLIELYVPQERGAGDIAIEFGWGTEDATGSVEIRVAVNGQAEVYKSGVFQGRYSISNLDAEVRRFRAGDTQQTGPTGAITGKIVSLFCIPATPRNLLVFSSAGGGFCHQFADLAAEGVNTITPAGNVWWRVARGKASVQVNPLTFPTTGVLYRGVEQWREAPPTGATFSTGIAAAANGYSMTSVVSVSAAKTDGTPFVPNGVLDTVRVKVSLAGTVEGSPYVYGAEVAVDPAVTDTDDSEETDIADWVDSISFAVAEGPDGVSGSFLLKEKASLTVAAPRRQSNRPMKIRLSDIDANLDDAKNLLIGITGKPKYAEGPNDPTLPEVPVAITIPFTDEWKRLEDTRFEENFGPLLDGLTISAAVSLLLDIAGVPGAERDIETNALPIPQPWSLPCEFEWQPEPGSSVAEWITKIWETFAPTWYMGFYPTSTGQKFRFRSEATLSATPAATIYWHRNGTYDGSKIACTRFDEECIPPEATRFAVWGYIPGLRQYYVRRSSDASLEDPTLAPSDRPAGWRGQVEAITIFDTRLSSVDAVNEGHDQMVERVGSELLVAEWACRDVLRDSSGVPLWRGSVVRVKNRTGDTIGDYRILSFGGTMNRDYDRKINYVGKKIA